METHNLDGSYVALFSALVDELRTRQKQLLVMQLAEILAKRAIADAGQSGTALDVAETAAQLIRNISSPARALPRRAPARNNQVIDTAKEAIGLEFKLWRALHPGTTWHALFARNMNKKYGRDQQTIEEWALVWEIEARIATSANLSSDHSRALQTNGMASSH